MSDRQETVRAILDAARSEGLGALAPPQCKAVCDAYGIPLPGEGLAQSADEARVVADGIGYPVAMKIVSPDILHKTEAGGVVVGVADGDAAAAAYEAIVAGARAYQSDARIDSVQVQQMVTGGAQEVIVGAVTDPSFGKLVAFGLGGVLVEVLKDITFRLAPATADHARSMLDGIQAAEVLDGVRGAEAVDRDALADIIVNVSELIGDFPEISEIDLNPVLAGAQGATAVDALIAVDFSPQKEIFRPSQEEIVAAMDRIMNPRAVAVIGASEGEGKIGNSVMKNIINGGYAGELYPINPKADEILGRKAYKSVMDVPGVIDVAVFAVPARFCAGAMEEVGRKGIPGAIMIPSGFAEVGETEAQDELLAVARKHGVRIMGPNIYGFYYTPSNLCATFCTPYDVKGEDGAVVPERRRGHVHYRLQPFDEDGGVGHRRAGQQIRPGRGRPAHLLRAGRQHRRRRHARRGPERRTKLRRSRQTGLEEEAGGDAQGRTYPAWRKGRRLAHRRAGRQRQGLRRHPPGQRRDPRLQPERHAAVLPRSASVAGTEGREHRHHHRRGRFGRAASRRGGGPRLLADEVPAGPSTKPSSSTSHPSAPRATRWI